MLALARISTLALVPLVPLVPLVVMLSSCSSSSDSPPPPPPPPPYNSLFDPLPAATPNTLRGVWSRTQASNGNSTELRLRFSEGEILAGVKCTYSQAGFQPLITGQSSTAEIEGLDGATTGKLTPGVDLSFSAKPDARICQGLFKKLAYQFTIKDAAMTLMVTGETGTLLFNKVGD